ncbi:F-box only protein 16-like isoform X2 [Tubulanus polymorphus]|uniref:F-box only protein 16-like isoform X2 n=1 Tax=Tubulanus polymorphus TaxID=672921 RepID=UPI003DA3DA2D
MPAGLEPWKITIFEERRALVGKWFDKWTDDQRRKVLQDLLLKCKVKQLQFSGTIINQKVPVYNDDFTRRLPRVICLYIMGFLDPRSLCRCSQVCWFWKHLSEADQIWMPKCLRLGWYLTFVPSPYETGIWKRNYIENIKSLQYLRPKEIPAMPADDKRTETEKTERTVSIKKPKASPIRAWRGSDPRPQDTWRFNYLDNDDEIQKVQKLRQKGLYGPEAELISAQAKSKVKTGRENLSRQKRSKSLTKLNGYIRKEEPLGEDGRPKWATHKSGSPFVNQSYMGDTKTGLNAGVRPGPVVNLRKTTVKRTPRDPPSSELFKSTPWQLPGEDALEDV